MSRAEHREPSRDAWPSQKSFQRRDQTEAPPKDDPGNPIINFHGETRRNDPHESRTDPVARLARKGGGEESKLAYCGNAMIENRNGLSPAFDLLAIGCVGARLRRLRLSELVTV